MTETPSGGPLTFHTTIEGAKKTATGVRTPDGIIAALGAGKRPPVVDTINGASYRNTVAVDGR